jgi:hypothetical protein
MITITSNYVSKQDAKTIKSFTRFVLDKFVRLGIQRKTKIHIKVLTPEEVGEADALDLKDYKAWCTYDSHVDDIKKFTIVVNAKRMTSAKKPEIRLRNLLVDLGHELVHVKQYLNGELRDYVDGSYKYLGQKYDPIPDGKENIDKYFDSPMEIEAYGREWGLYVSFSNKLIAERKTKK